LTDNLTQQLNSVVSSRNKSRKT